jgi:hypothetical protein
MLPCTQKLKDLSWKPVGIILSGGPSSVYSPDAPNVDPLVFELGVPVLYVQRQKNDEKAANVFVKGSLLWLSTNWYYAPWIYLSDS